MLSITWGPSVLLLGSQLYVSWSLQTVVHLSNVSPNSWYKTCSSDAGNFLRCIQKEVGGAEVWLNRSFFFSNGILCKVRVGCQYSGCCHSWEFCVWHLPQILNMAAVTCHIHPQVKEFFFNFYLRILSYQCMVWNALHSLCVQRI